MFLLDDTTWYKAARDTADIPLEAIGRWTKTATKARPFIFRCKPQSASQTRKAI